MSLETQPLDRGEREKKSRNQMSLFCANKDEELVGEKEKIPLFRDPIREVG